MIKVITCNIFKDYNFGGPSILLGIKEVLNHIFGEDYEIINLEYIRTPKLEKEISGVRTYYHDVFNAKNPFSLLSSSTNERLNIFGIIKLLKQADVIVDLNGICFCDNFFKEVPPKWKQCFSIINSFFIAVIGKFVLKKVIIKNAASFGPIVLEYNKKAAEFMCSNVFDVIIAREEQSKNMLPESVLFKTIVSPDIANLLPFDNDGEHIMNSIAISVSQEVCRQWASDESYLDCIYKMCIHIVLTYKKNIILIPNESSPEIKNDVDIAKAIVSRLSSEYKSYVSILPVESMDATEIKSVISKSFILVASRYHSCVAGLSACVPTLVIGWHYKYEELLALYGQGEYLISHNQCNSKLIIEKIDYLIKNRHEVKGILTNRRTGVKKKTIGSFREALNMLGLV